MVFHVFSAKNRCVFFLCFPCVSSQETVRKKALAQVEARECHLLERFRVRLPIESFIAQAPTLRLRPDDVVFREQGDALPEEIKTHVEEPQKQIQTWSCRVGCDMF